VGLDELVSLAVEVLDQDRSGVEVGGPQRNILLVLFILAVGLFKSVLELAIGLQHVLSLSFVVKLRTRDALLQVQTVS
jgi:hypothetical protein